MEMLLELIGIKFTAIAPWVISYKFQCYDCGSCASLWERKSPQVVDIPFYGDIIK